MFVLVTGSAGFIGFHVAAALLQAGHHVVGVDNFNDYYDVELKRRRNEILLQNAAFRFETIDIADDAAMETLFTQNSFSHVIHLAAQAGVRYSLINPKAYGKSNLTGFLNILEGCRHSNVSHLVYASSSSVYGFNTKTPFSEAHNVDHPVSLYAATKKSNELMAHSYSHLYGLPTTGLRFFTVYGPWGRPDMALFLFTKAILAEKPINVFNGGNLSRDFTYIDDITKGVIKTLENTPYADPGRNGESEGPVGSPAPYRIFNIGNNNAVKLERFISVLEDALGKKAIKNHLPMQPGDVHTTYADIDALVSAVGYAPTTPIEKGIPLFVAWYKKYYQVA